jgi:pimeloyl-ACP methyl ester carboxylesterase
MKGERKMKKSGMNAKKWIYAAVVLMLISMIGASLVQTGGGKIKIKDLRFETANGTLMSGLLFVPPNATVENPAPAIIASHGLHNNREWQDIFYVELARRGYVVLSIDMFNHGWSELVIKSIVTGANGMYDAVQMIATLDYVDKTKIGVTGHSMGGMSIGASILKDNEAEKPLIAAAFYVAGPPSLSDGPWYAPSDHYFDAYGTRDLGVLAAQYDEFFFKGKYSDGSIAHTRDYIKTKDAQSLLYHGADVDKEGLQNRSANTLYHDTIRGTDSIRAIYTPALTHRLSHFSALAASDMMDFFNEAFGEPNPISSKKQVWQLKQTFNLIGVCGFFIFLVNFTIVMLSTVFFSSLRATEPVQALAVAKGGKAVFFGTIALGALISAFFFYPVLNTVAKWVPTKVIVQEMPFLIASWAFFNAIVSIIMMVLINKFYLRKNNLSLKGRGISISTGKLGKTLLLGVIVVIVTMSTVFFADYFFKTDFRLFVFSIKAFQAQYLLWSIPTFILMLIYFMSMSVSVNCFNYNTIGKAWVNTAILAIGYIIGPVIMRIIQYSVYFTSGEMVFTTARSLNPMYLLWLFPTTVILVAAVVISRKIYRKTGNPYLGGFINAVIFTIITCTNAMVW